MHCSMWISSPLQKLYTFAVAEACAELQAVTERFRKEIYRKATRSRDFTASRFIGENRRVRLYDKVCYNFYSEGINGRIQKD